MCKIRCIFIGLLLGVTVELQAFTFPSHHPLLNNNYAKDSNALYLNFYNTNFLWNNEFFNDIVNGYTLIGYFLTPEFQYHITPSIKIQGGVHLLKYTGAEDFSTISPTYAAIFTKDDYTLIMGKLWGTINHRVPDPLLFSERFFTNNLENGVQFIVDKDRFFFDTWLDWQSFIFPQDNKQEQLAAGISTHPWLIKSQKWEISTPASLIVGHRGGQIDTLDIPMRTLLNSSLGGKVLYKLPYKFLDRVSFETHLVGFKDNSPTMKSLYSSGQGSLSQLTFGLQGNYFQIGYWHSNQFLSLMGHPIFQSYSEKGTGYHQRIRELLTFHLFYSKDIYKGIYLGLMGDTYVDLINGNVDYSMGLTLIIKHNFFLKRFKGNEKGQG